MGCEYPARLGSAGVRLGAALYVMLAACSAPPNRTADGGPPARRTDPIEVVDQVLADRMHELSRRSPTWRAGLDTVRAGAFRVLVARPDQVPARVPALRYYRPRHFGEVLPLRDRTGSIVGAVVTVDTRRLSRLYRRASLPPSSFDADVDRILIHEIYGHVVPLSQARELAGGCPDPLPGQPALSSCAIQRENRIRAELGYEPRLSYDLRGLAIGRYLYATGLPVADLDEP